MKQNTYIVTSWDAEVKQQKKQIKETKQSRYAALIEFKESICDLFDMADFYYYAERIGCRVGYLLNIARYSTDSNYIRSARNLSFRRQFYIDNGHSITKPNPLFS